MRDKKGSIDWGRNFFKGIIFVGPPQLQPPAPGDC